MVQRDHLGQAEARQPHQARAAAPPRDVVDELDRRPVAPVQVFGHQQQRPLLGVAVEQLAHLAQHAVGAHAGQFAPQRVAFLRGAQPRQLQQPGRRHAAQQRGQSAVLAAQLGHRLQHRQVRLAGAVVLHALAARDRRRPRGRRRSARSAWSCRCPARRRPRPPPAARRRPGSHAPLQPGDRVGAADERRRLAAGRCAPPPWWRGGVPGARRPAPR